MATSSVHDLLEDLLDAISHHQVNTDTRKQVCKVAKFCRRTTDKIGSNTSVLLNELKWRRHFWVECINEECTGDIGILKQIIAGIEQNGHLLEQYDRLADLIVLVDARPSNLVKQMEPIQVPAHLVTMISGTFELLGTDEAQLFLQELGYRIQNSPALTTNQLKLLTCTYTTRLMVRRGLDMFMANAAESNSFHNENAFVSHIRDVLLDRISIPRLANLIEQWRVDHCQI